MRISAEIITVHPRHPFATSRDRTVESQSAVIRIEHDGVVGVGEAKVSADACGGKAEPVCDHVAGAQGMLGRDWEQIRPIHVRLLAAPPVGLATPGGCHGGGQSDRLRGAIRRPASRPWVFSASAFRLLSRRLGRSL